LFSIDISDSDLSEALNLILRELPSSVKPFIQRQFAPFGAPVTALKNTTEDTSLPNRHTQAACGVLYCSEKIIAKENLHAL
jgi:hypothetical protein